jgi:uncharacterized protein (DUF983 family)
MSELVATVEKREVATAMLRGFACRCPSCGKGSLFGRFLKGVPACEACGEDLSHQRADDFPAYIVMFITGHVLIPLVLLVETTWKPEIWVHAALWVPLTLALCIGLLQPVKGTVIGLQWALRMHGFSGKPDEAAS